MHRDKTWKTIPSGSGGGTQLTVAGTLNEVVVSAKANDVQIIGLSSAITSAIGINTAKVGITTEQADEITINNSKISYPAADSIKLASIEDNADVTDTENVVNSLTAGTNINIATDGTISSTAAATGGDGLSITDSVNLNLLDGTTVLSTVILPSTSGTTIIAGTAGEIVNSVSGDTNTLSLDTSVTGAINNNTAKVGITPTQATEITANTSKVGITSDQITAIGLNTLKTGITTTQAADILTNNAKDGITTEQSNEITVNTAKVGITTEQTNAIVDNTNKVGITPTQAGAIVTNTSKVGITTDQADEIDANTLKVGITTDQANEIDANTLKVGITTEQANMIAVNTLKSGITTAQSDAIIANTNKIGVSPSTVKTAIGSGINDTDYLGNDGTWRVIPTGGGGSTSVTGTADEIVVDTVGDTATVSLSPTITDAIDANTAKISTTKANVDTAIGDGAVDTDYYASDKTWKTIPSGASTQLTVNGTTDQIDVSNKVANTQTVSLNSTVTDAIDANTAKVTYPAEDSTKLAGIENGADITDTINVVGSLTAGNNITIGIDGTIAATGANGTVTSISVGTGLDVFDATTTPTINLDLTELTDLTEPSINSDQMILLDGGVQGRKPFNEVGVSVFDNDANYSTTVGTVTNVTGVSPITVSTGTTTPSIGFDFSTVNTWSAVQLFSIIRASALTGLGDSNTFIDLSVPDTLTLTAGSVDFIDCVEDATDTLVINSGRTDMDVDFRKNTSGSWMNYNAGTDTITLSAAAFAGFPSASVNKASVDSAIGASTGGSSGLFYNQQGNFTAPAGGGGGGTTEFLTTGALTSLSFQADEGGGSSLSVETYINNNTRSPNTANGLLRYYNSETVTGASIFTGGAPFITDSAGTVMISPVGLDGNAAITISSGFELPVVWINGSEVNTFTITFNTQVTGSDLPTFPSGGENLQVWRTSTVASSTGTFPSATEDIVWTYTTGNLAPVPGQEFSQGAQVFYNGTTPATLYWKRSMGSLTTTADAEGLPDFNTTDWSLIN